MTSTNTHRGTQDAPAITLHAALNRAFLTAKLPGDPHMRLVEDYETAADIAVRVAEAFIAQAEAGARADERHRIADQLRDWAKASHPMSIGRQVLEVAADKLDLAASLTVERK